MAPTRIRPETRENAKRLRRDMTPPERKLWQYLRAMKSKDVHFRRQAPIGPYFADFAWLQGRMIIEIDGETHFQGGAQDKDRERDRYLTDQEFRILRFTNLDIHDNYAGALETILAELSKSNRRPNGTDQ